VKEDGIDAERLSVEELDARARDAQTAELTLSWNVGPFRWREETWARTRSGEWAIMEARVDIRDGL